MDEIDVGQTIGWALVFGVVAAVWLVLRRFGLLRSQHNCPSCESRHMYLKAMVQGRTAYECRICGEQFMKIRGGPLIARAEWEAGKRDDPPRARVVKR